MNTDASSRKDHLAAEVVSRWTEFQTALSEKRKYPHQQFRSFADVTRRYVQAMRGDALIHRSVVEAINGLTDFLTAERKHVPQDVLWNAERLECLVFGGTIHTLKGEPPRL